MGISCAAHTDHVLCVAIAPDGEAVATAGKDGEVIVWSREGTLFRRLRGHRQWVNALAWEPLHKWSRELAAECTSQSLIRSREWGGREGKGRQSATGAAS